MDYNFFDVEPFLTEPIDAFMLPPSGTNTIADFKIISHVNLKIPKQNKSIRLVDDDSDFE